MGEEKGHYPRKPDFLSSLKGAGSRAIAAHEANRPYQDGKEGKKEEQGGGGLWFFPARIREVFVERLMAAALAISG